MKIVLVFCVIAFSISCSESTRETAPVNHSDVDHSKMDHGSMDHSTMESSPGAANAPIELQFIDTMIAHHRGAIDMAKLADGRTENRQLKSFAEGIINAQDREITVMSGWRTNWFGEKPAAVNMDFPGMRQGMNDMNISKLTTLKGVEFDLEFVRQMKSHHEGAVTMANELKSGDSYKELKQLAETIIKDQTGEIEQMNKWQAEWSKQK
jgi:uncharacterized protein (DUF305 family)